ncbi:glycosyltransferase [Propionicicella superfundia]|uniref:glycosyltransferase n=1 Tax=Propionicicella superfundia TaxID=348582 RepID=UPI0005640E9B|nr:glycosyltransferase [Propionicicella superfundia]
MKVLIGTDTYPPTVNGAAMFTERFAHALVERSHEVHLVCPSPTGVAETITDSKGVTVHRRRSVPYPFYENFRLSPIGAARCRPVVEDVGPDVIHVQDHFWLCASVTRAARALDVPFVATNHLMPENFFDHVPVPKVLRGVGSKWVWGELDRVFAGASAITSPTPKAVELLERATAFRGAIPISNGIDVARYEEAAARHHLGVGRYSSDPTILFVGRLDQEKRVNELITAFSQLPASLGARLEIVGNGSLRGAWERLAESLDVADRVVFRGFVEEDELVDAFGRADIFVMPGVAELQSIVTMEAMAAGKPVVAANAMALPHLVKPEVNGYLFTPGDSDDLASRLGLLLADPGLRDRMGAASRRIVAQHAMGVTVDKFLALYQDAIEGVRHV